ncbi:hypothetical protein TNCV_3761781 [Trichonephila clavipes]|nr:hypothetical protein TNCV_3761781 [Trichonephila clavipes]
MIRQTILFSTYQSTRTGPHKLSDNNRTDRVRIFTELLQRNEQTSFLKNLVTGDESRLLQKLQKKEGLHFARFFSQRNIETCPLKEGYVVGQKCSWNRSSAKQMGISN